MRPRWPIREGVYGSTRKAQTAAHLVDHVIPHVPLRQWVLIGVMSIPGPWRRPAFAEKYICVLANQRLGSFGSSEASRWRMAFLSKAWTSKSRVTVVRMAS